ncbi:hypothetical protein EDD21DRAFT_134988 [Dissophora ornata]|nr:hypothetical protein EDD21DRAFT_134988 [Dissophora ornata]
MRMDEDGLDGWQRWGEWNGRMEWDGYDKDYRVHVLSEAVRERTNRTEEREGRKEEEREEREGCVSEAKCVSAGSANFFSCGPQPTDTATYMSIHYPTQSNSVRFNGACAACHVTTMRCGTRGWAGRGFAGWCGGTPVLKDFVFLLSLCLCPGPLFPFPAYSCHSLESTIPHSLPPITTSTPRLFARQEHQQQELSSSPARRLSKLVIHHGRFGDETNKQGHPAGKRGKRMDAGRRRKTFLPVRQSFLTQSGRVTLQRMLRKEFDEEAAQKRRERRK